MSDELKLFLKSMYNQFMVKWSILNEGRLYFEHSCGFLVIKPDDDRVIVPLTCPVCTTPMLRSDDNIAFRKYSCCSACERKWVDITRDSWVNELWRPNTDEIAKELKRRNIRAKPIKI